MQLHGRVFLALSTVVNTPFRGLYASANVCLFTNLRFIYLQTCGFTATLWALVEVKLGDAEEINKASLKLLSLANDIDEKEHPRPAFLMIITCGAFASRDKNGVYIVPLGCLKP
ncbi:MAG: hypothetical protein IJS37_04970 [Bacilli bacterium]|nr:hypothetical protein [Bacilli bacterium]